MALGGMQPEVLAAPAKGQDFEELLGQADEHAIEGRHAEALQTYEQAYAAMPVELKATGVGELVVLAAGKAAIGAYEADGNVQWLVRGRALLVDFIKEVSARPDAAPPSVDAARARLEEIDATLPETTEASSPPEPPPAAPEPATTTIAPTDDGPKPGSRRKAGLALAVSGGVITLGGLALLVAGTRQVPWFQQRMEELGWTPDHPDYATEAARAERTRDIDIGVGAGVMVVGVGLGVTGAVLMARSRKPPAVAFSGAVGRDGALLTARLRF
ncbi:MAG: hypothetical protein KC501_38765 [Myxococcales bacterium]|nr:hypothetical protein [Myxococcales bacterium]